MAAQRKHHSFAFALAVVASCKQPPSVPTPSASAHTSTAVVVTADAAPADTLPLGDTAGPFVVDNAICDCVEVIASVEAKRMKLRFTVVKPIYKCGCPSAAVRYSIVKGGRQIASDHFSAMKYTDRWFVTHHPLRPDEASQYGVTVGCNVD
jgi:hypothetical protein